MQRAELQTVISVLTRLLKTETGRSLLPPAIPYLDAALQSPTEPLRRLSAQQFSSMLLPSQQRVSGSDCQMHHHAVNQLLVALRDQDTGMPAQPLTTADE